MELMVAFLFFFFKERHFLGGPVTNAPCSQYWGSLFVP